MKSTLSVLVLFCFVGTASAQTLRISDDQRYIVYEDGTPFFWLGDTAWELFHRTTKEEADLYLENRAAKGFTVIQAVVLAELEGITVPTPQGHTPLLNNNPATPNEAYFEHVDYIVDKAASLGMFIGMLPTWGDKFNIRWGVGPEVFTPENARVYGEFLGARYRDKPIIWILGGDRIPENEDDFAIIRAMADGITQGDGGRNLMTYHPMGGRSSAEFFHDDAWLDLNMYQSGHGQLNNPNYNRTAQDYNRTPVKPVLDGEPCYEDHPINWQPGNGWFDEFDSRRAGYWSMLSGAAGHTYGNHNIWQMWLPGRSPISSARTPWHQSIDYPGAFQAGYMRRLFESRPWQRLKSAQNLLRSGANTGGRDMRVAAASDGSFLMAYTPYGQTFELSLESIQGKRISVSWFNPRNGTSIRVGETFKPLTRIFDPPVDEGRGNDWVLVVDRADQGFGPPGE